MQATSQHHNYSISTSSYNLKALHEGEQNLKT